MQIILVSSKTNLASMNMHKLLVSEYGFKEIKEKFDNNNVYEKHLGNYTFKLIQSNKGILEIGYVQDNFNPDLYIIISTHKSEAKTKSLSCHISGDWKKGVPSANPNVLRNVYLKLVEMKSKFNLNKYLVTLEVTHHEPYELNAPSVWVEVGGSEEEWNDLVACKACCEAIMNVEYSDCFDESFNDSSENNLPCAVGFGGPHYAPNFMKDYLLEKVAVGHICSKHAIDGASEEVILDAFLKSESKEGAKCIAIIDWKGTVSEQRKKLVDLFESNGRKWKKVTDFKDDE